jgi:hypothetical protein
MKNLRYLKSAPVGGAIFMQMRVERPRSNSSSVSFPRKREPSALLRFLKVYHRGSETQRRTKDFLRAVRADNPSHCLTASVVENFYAATAAK